jgi:hypothetical protein
VCHALHRGVVSAISFLAITSFAQSRIEVEDLAHHPFNAEFSSGGQIDLHIRSAKIQIAGSDENRIGVRVSGEQGSKSTDMKARFGRSKNSWELRITGGPHNELTITVRVPKNSDLFVRILAGDVEVKGITGNKDIELHAGDLTISVGDASDYAHVQASVTTGDIEARPFGESHGGLFRSFAKSGSGKYKLLAHVGAGELTLN